MLGISLKWNYTIFVICVWLILLSMFSGFVHVVACQNSFLLKTEYSFIVDIDHVLFTHSSVHAHSVVSTSGLFCIPL